MRKLMLALGATAMAVPVMIATPAAAGDERQTSKGYKEWVGKDGKRYCRKSDGTVGLVVGGVGGVLVGRAIDSSGDRTLGTLAGAAAGALAGRAIDREISKKKCS